MLSLSMTINKLRGEVVPIQTNEKIQNEIKDKIKNQKNNNKKQYSSCSVQVEGV